MVVAAWAPHTREVALGSKPPFPQLQKVGLGVEMHALDPPNREQGGSRVQGQP